MNDLKRFLFYWAPFLVYVFCIFALSSISLTTGPVSIHDKPIHFLEYCILAFLLSRAVGKAPLPDLSWRQNVTILGIGSLVGVMDEFIQSFTPGRFSSVLDWYADVAGILGMITILLIRRQVRETRPEVL